MTNQPYTVTLHKLLTTHFNLSELNQLAFALDIEWEELAGETRSDKTRSLVMNLARNGSLAHLITLTRKQRKHVTWPDPPPPDQQIATAASETPQTTSKYNINAPGANIGVIGDNIQIKGGINFGKPPQAKDTD